MFNRPFYPLLRLPETVFAEIIGSVIDGPCDGACSKCQQQKISSSPACDYLCKRFDPLENLELSNEMVKYSFSRIFATSIKYEGKGLSFSPILLSYTIFRARYA